MERSDIFQVLGFFSLECAGNLTFDGHFAMVLGG
jgi:hypothetical protein